MGFAMRPRKVGAGSPHPGQEAGEEVSEERAMAVGIDLGTSFTRIAIWSDGDVLIIPNERGSFATPSCVAFTEHSVLVGEAAQEQADANMENTIFAPQRLIGFRFDNPWVQWYMRLWPSKIVRGEDDKPWLRVRVRGKEQLLRPEDVVTILLAHLRRVAERHLHTTVVDAVVTVPARYGQNQREAIVEACRGARLNVVDLVKAPTSAGIAYALTNESRAKGNVLICDMGSSYFDFALVSMDGGRLTERAIGTDYVDLDKCLLRFCLEDLREKWGLNIAGDIVMLQRLRRACETAKKKLSACNQARIEVKALTPSVDYICVLSRVHFEELCRDDIEPLLDPIAWCIEDCGMEKGDVHEVVLVGGSARIPGVRQVIRGFFYGKKPMEVLRPDHAAVLGAAAYGAVLSGRSRGELPVELKHIDLQQVTPWSTLPEGVELEFAAIGDTLDERSASPARLSIRATPPPKPATRPSFSELVRPMSALGDLDLPRVNATPTRARPSFSELAKPASVAGDAEIPSDGGIQWPNMTVPVKFLPHA